MVGLVESNDERNINSANANDICIQLKETKIMCTGLCFKAADNNVLFGRNMDLAYEFNQQVIIMPEGYQYEDKVSGNMVTNKVPIIGMGTCIDNHVVYAEAMSIKGLACAGLNFARYAYFEPKSVEGKINLAPYDFIQWVLSNFSTVEEAKEAIKGIELIDAPLNKDTPVALLHWMISDKSGASIVVEKTKAGLKVYDNPVGVMTNDPTFDWHLTNLNEYLYLTPEHHPNVVWREKELKALGIGSGTLGIPGDFASVSRFVRIAYICTHTPKVEGANAISHVFNMLEYVKMVRGGVRTEDGREDNTLYSACMDLENGIYYYRTRENSRVNAVSLKNADCTNGEPILFPYKNEQDFNYQN